MGTFRLYTGSDGQSRIEPIDLGRMTEWTKGLAATQISFREWPLGQYLDWHPAPRRQFVIILSGQLEIGLGDGSKHVFGPGDARLVQLLSAGYDRVDVEAARKAGVPVANNGGANAIAVAEHTLMLMLAVLRRLVRLHNDVVAGKWQVGNFAETRVYELAGKTLGIVGLGNIGKKVARRAAAFDMDIQHHDIARLTQDQEDALRVRFGLLAELLRTSDVVSLHVP